MIKYILRILEHKWWVFYYGWQMHVPLWQLIIHDWKAAGKVYQGKDEAKEWYFKDPTRFQLHPSTKNTVEGLLLVYEDPKNSPHCSCGVDKFWSKKPWYKHRRHCALYYSVVGIKEALDA